MQFFSLCLGAILCCFSPFLMADEAFLNARTAFLQKDLKSFEKWRKLSNEPKLERYLESWYWRLTLVKNAQNPAVLDFLKRYENSVVAEKFRQVWLNELVQQKAWALILNQFEKIHRPTVENQCAFEKAKIETANTDLLKDIPRLKKEWLKNLNPQLPCALLLEDIFKTGNITSEEWIARVRLQIEENKINAAKKTLQLLSKPPSFWADDIQRAFNDSLRFLAKLPHHWEKNDQTRMLASFALARYISKNLKEARAQFLKLESSFSNDEKAWLWSQIALYSAKAHQPEALNYFQKTTSLTPLAMEWKTRAALRAQDWKKVKESILNMPDSLANQSVWIYWLGRAYAAENNAEQAQAQYAKIAGQFHYYANLAAEELGQRLELLPAPENPSPEEMLQIQLNEDLQRALLLFQEDIRPEAVQEWNWGIQNLEDSKLLAAAFWAKEQKVWDRAINTALRTKNIHHFPLRFLAPFKEMVQKEAENQQLDLAWVYGLMRQESRFITHAKSSVGASGLMQLMPKTAKWVAKKIGLKDYALERVNDHDVNILLGTSYMRMILDDLDNHILLASAAYNAGPGRAKRWRAALPLEGAIYAETIPFNETRDYVQKVLNNAVYYSILFNGKSDSLKKRLGVVLAQKETHSALP